MFRKISLAAVAALALTAAAVAPRPPAASTAAMVTGITAMAIMVIMVIIMDMVTGAITTLGHRSMSAEAATRRSSPSTDRAPSTSATATTERA